MRLYFSSRFYLIYSAIQPHDFKNDNKNFVVVVVVYEINILWFVFL